MTPNSFSRNMTDFFKCCFPSARQRCADDEIELVSAAALPGTRRRRHNTGNLRAEITAAPTTVAVQPTEPYPYRRRPSEDLQDLVGTQAQKICNIDAAFNVFDRAHAHVLRDLDSALQHCRYAVSGSYAEALWGCPRAKRRNTVSIMCQSSSRKTIRVWLYSQSLFTISLIDENMLEYQGDLMGSEPISVRIRWVSDRELQRLPIIESNIRFREGPLEPVSEIRLVLLTLPALADNVAWSWVNARDQRAREDFAADLFSVLDRIVDLNFAHDGTGPLSAEGNVHILSKDFWIPFTKVYPYALELLAQCGAPIPDFAVITSQPQAERDMHMSRPFLDPNSFQKPRLAPLPPAVPRTHSRTVTAQSSVSKRPSLSNLVSSTKHRKSSSSSRPRHPSTTSKPRTRHPLPDLSPKRPVHPANIVHPVPETRSRFSALFGLKESSETLERRRREKLENDRAARRANEKLAAKIQRNRERDREREWHTRKQSERMGLQ
ncbi:hypothetical protein N0V93_001900 [Gnomoniopsis smithogilvyi]|uniref:Uncharacterized protein n=1 Tax=Gnomoniopsis smithogilvyi TaxID=1191159 RepID=A0A9W9D1N3_9PEZI|nr:hypothetical protein N0V93_001900 [Gnomoniopsis smithogilvyi]